MTDEDSIARVPPSPAAPAGQGRLSLRANFSWTAAAMGFYSLMQWAMLLVLVKWGDPMLVGLYTLGAAVAAPISTFAGLGLTEALVTDVRERCPYGRYLALRVATSALSVAVVAGIGFGFYPLDRAIIIALVGLTNALYAVRDILTAIMRRHERMDLAARSQVILGAAALVLFAAAFGLTRRLAGESGSTLALAAGLAALCAARLGVAGLHDLRIARRFARHADGDRLWQGASVRQVLPLVVATLPLGLSATLSTVIGSIPRYFLEAGRGTRELGYFGALSSIVVAATVMANTLVMAATPRLAIYFAGNRRAFVLLVGKLMLAAVAFGAVGLIAAALAGRWILTVVFEPDYAQYAGEFIVLMLAMLLLFVVSFLNQIVIATRGFSQVMLVNAVAALACLVACVALVPAWGLAGACWAMVVAHAVWAGMFLAILRRRLRIAAT